MHRALLPLSLLCIVSACAPSGGQRPASQDAPKLRSLLSSFCADLRADACRPELAGADEKDLATIVLADLGERDPEFEQFLTRSLAGVPAAQRKAAIEKNVSDVLGAPWTCPTLDTLWANQRPACE